VTLTGAVGSPGRAKNTGDPWVMLSGVPDSFMAKLGESANWLAYGLVGAVAAAVMFQGLESENALKMAPAGAAAGPANTSSTATHANGHRSTRHA
jgi:hypothetical protein